MRQPFPKRSPHHTRHFFVFRYSPIEPALRGPSLVVKNWCLCPRFRFRRCCVPFVSRSAASLWPRFRLRRCCVPLCPALWLPCGLGFGSVAVVSRCVPLFLVKKFPRCARPFSFNLITGRRGGRAEGEAPEAPSLIFIKFPFKFAAPQRDR